MFYDTSMKYARFLIILLISWSVSFAEVRAETPDPCAIISEEIIDLLPPEFDKALRFKRTYGVEGLDQAVKILPLADLGFVMVGMTSPVTRSPQATQELIEAPPTLYLNRHDKTGKLIWETRHPIKNLRRVADAVVIKDQIIIAADTVDGDVSSVLLYTVDGLGKKIKEDKIRSPKKSLSARAMVGQGAAVILAVSSQSLKKDAVSTTKIIKQSLNGKPIFNRDYLADIPSRIEGLKRMSDNSIIAVGRARISGSRMGGWILRISDKGDIISSDLFPRGRQASLNSIDVLADGSFITAGEVIGSNISADMAAWVMRLPAQSVTPLWQSYIKGSYAYEGLKVLPLIDGRAQILLAAKAVATKESAGRDHGRVLTYTAEGRMVDVESFIEGSNARPRDLVQHGEFRILAGQAQTGFSNASHDSLAYRSTYDVWVAGLPVPKPVSSLCASPVTNMNLLDE